MKVLGFVATVPLAGSFAAPIFNLAGVRKRVVALGFLVAVTALVFVMSAAIFVEAYRAQKPMVYTFGGWPAPVGIVFTVDKTSALLGLVASFLFLSAAIFSLDYMREHPKSDWFVTLLLGLEAGVLGCFYTGDAFNFFVMLEVASVAAYGLVGISTEDKNATYAALRYAFIGSVATTVYLLAVGIYYGSFGTVNFANFRAILDGGEFFVASKPFGVIKLIAPLGLVVIVWALSVEGAIFPNHFWLPDAHSAAPTPVSALLSGIFVAVGAYGVLRYISTVFSGQPYVEFIRSILLLLGGASAIFGGWLMLVQEDVKRIVAYSTIMHMGYVFMAMGLGTAVGFAAAIFHVAYHGVAKALMFLALGPMIKAAGSRLLKDLRGIGGGVPTASFGLGVASLSLVGVPPFNVFYSKLYLLRALVEKSWVWGFILVLSSALALVAYLRVFYGICIEKREEIPRKGTPPAEGFSIVVLSILCIALGVFAPLVFNKWVAPAGEELLKADVYIKSVLEALGKVGP